MRNQVKIRWVIQRKDGTCEEIYTEEEERNLPFPGDGKFMEGIGVRVDKVLKTPTLGKEGEHDVVVQAQEITTDQRYHPR
ncbi:MAG: hypothetical protein GDA52_06385 [Rhodobacteraceae bacterium]|nr:hypothetical protein [Paracoccaceae bacterium]